MNLTWSPYNNALRTRVALLNSKFPSGDDYIIVYCELYHYYWVNPQLKLEDSLFLRFKFTETQEYKDLVNKDKLKELLESL